MGIYIFRRIVLVAFIIMSLILIWSLFGPTDYHYTRYKDVRIISEKIESIRNPECIDKNHPHYYINSNVVTWKGVDSKGNICEFTTDFDSDGDSFNGTCGTSYYDIKDKHIATIHNCFKSGMTWVGFIITLVFFICSYCTEDLDFGYDWEDAEPINNWRFCVWGFLSKFMGYDPNIVDKVIEHYKYRNNNKIKRYKDLFNKYNEEYKNSIKTKI